MKVPLLLIISFLFIGRASFAQTSGSITIGGDFDKFYPVTWTDPGWSNNEATILRIGRSSVHQNSSWRGALIADFSYHISAWGNGANFIDASIRQSEVNFVGGWRDASTGGTSGYVIIWLRGGGTTYQFIANYSVNVSIYDGIQNSLPFEENNGPAHNYKTAVDSYVNSAGISNSGTAYFTGSGSNCFLGDVGIGTATPREKLSVNGKIRAQEIKVETANWPDYVFENKYEPSSLTDLETFIKANKHLPEIPSAKEAEENGISLGEMNAKLLKKIEELTLHLIAQNKLLSEQGKQIKEQNKRIEQLEKNEK